MGQATERAQRWVRIAVVTAGLAALGVIFGGIAGSLVLLVAMIRFDGLAGLPDDLRGWGFVFFLGMAMGGMVGAVLGPLSAWTLMRRVPLWLAVTGPTLGTFASAGVSVLILPHPLFPVLAGAVGCVWTAAALYDRYEDAPPQTIGDLPPG